MMKRILTSTWATRTGAFGSCMLVLLAACTRSHEATGLVVAVDRPARIVTISHDPIPGLMDAMVMPLPAAATADLDELSPGDRIRFRLTIADGRSSIDRLVLLSAAPDAGAPGRSPASPFVAIGEPVHSFSLIDHRGAPVSLASLSGKVAVLSFIYTRCPLPDYCPRVMTTLGALRDRFVNRLGDDLVLVTVSFDPTHDTPERLKEFAGRYGADVRGWHLVTGSADEIRRLYGSLGVEVYPEDGMITHTLQVAVVGRDGRLAARAEGREYSARQLGDLVELQLRP